MSRFQIVLLILFLPVFLWAQEMKKSQPSAPATIQVDGEAVLQAKPDRAEVNLGVVTQSPDAKSAAAQNAQKLDRVINQLRKGMGQNLEIKTIGYSLSPNYTYPPQGGEPKITGYTASNTIQVRTDNLDQVGSIIDTATKSGANNVQSLEFVLKDDSAMQAQALREAAKKARSKADALASSLGVRVLRVLQVVEGGQQVIPVQRRTFAAEKMDVSTPVEPGTLEVRANVTLTVEIE